MRHTFSDYPRGRAHSMIRGSGRRQLGTRRQLLRPPVANPTVWLDTFDTEKSIVQDPYGTGVDQFLDKSGNGWHFYGLGGSNRPGYGGSRMRRLNGTPIVDFDGGDLMYGEELSWAPPFSFFAAIERDVLNAFHPIYGGQTSANQPMLRISNGNVLTLQNTSTGTGFSGPWTVGTGPMIVGSVVTATEATLWLNSDWSKGTHGHTFAGSLVMIGGDAFGSRWDGALAEMLLWQRELEREDQAKVVGYLRKKWYP